MAMARHLAWLCVAAWLAGCAQALTTPINLSGPIFRQSPVALIAPGRNVRLPGPADLGRSVEAAHMLSARHNGRTFAFEGRLSVTPEQLVLVGLDPMGRRAMTITWNGKDIAVESAPWMPQAIQPGNVLADIVVLLWPESVVRTMLAEAGCELRATSNARKVRCGEDEVLQARLGWAAGGKWTGTVQLTHLAWGY